MHERAACRGEHNPFRPGSRALSNQQRLAAEFALRPLTRRFLRLRRGEIRLVRDPAVQARAGDIRSEPVHLCAGEPRRHPWLYVQPPDPCAHHAKCVFCCRCRHCIHLSCRHLRSWHGQAFGEGERLGVSRSTLRMQASEGELYRALHHGSARSLGVSLVETHLRLHLVPHALPYPGVVRAQLGTGQPNQPTET